MKIESFRQKNKLPDYFDGILAEFIASLECSRKRISIYESVKGVSSHIYQVIGIVSFINNRNNTQKF